MEYSAYYTTRQPVLNRSNSISIPYSSASPHSQSSYSNRNSSTASQDSGYGSSMSNRTGNGERHRSGSPGLARNGNGNGNSPNWANSQDWDRFRDIITGLYRDEGLHLKKVQQIMLKEYNFSASERMYKTRISKWALDKNLKAHDVMVIYRLNQNRAMVGKRSTFTVRGRPMDYARVEQYIRRDPSIITRINSNDDLSEIPADHAHTAGITCRTPSPSPPPSPSKRSMSQGHPMGHTQTMVYNNYTGYAQPQQQHAHNGHRHAHPDQHYAQQRHSFAASAVLPSQATMPLSVPQMPLPLVTSAMAGFAGVPATAGPSVTASPYGASMYNTMGVNATSPTVSPFNTIVSTAGPNNSAYQLSGPAAPATTMAMMSANVSTPRTVNAEPRGYSFAPMPGYPEQGHPGQGHLMTGHQQHHSQHAHAASGSRANGHHQAGPNGNAALPESYNWNMDPNGPWDSQFR